MNAGRPNESIQVGCNTRKQWTRNVQDSKENHKAANPCGWVPSMGVARVRAGFLVGCVAQ